MIKKLLKVIITHFFTGLISAITVIFVILLFTSETLNEIKYKINEEIIDNDNTLQLVKELCNTHYTEIGKVRCVVNFYDNHYTISYHNESFRKASKFITEGGVCRDYAINICATLNEMGIECDYIFTANHVFPIIKFGENESYFYCINDRSWWCSQGI